LTAQAKEYSSAKRVSLTMPSQLAPSARTAMQQTKQQLKPKGQGDSKQNKI
jgi:hypothetical protein